MRAGCWMDSALWTLGPAKSCCCLAQVPAAADDADGKCGHTASVLRHQ
jgi:hypothetical protein